MKRCCKGDRWVLVEGGIKDREFFCGILVVYAPTNRDGRNKLLDELMVTRRNISSPLLIMSDFNEVTHAGERSSGLSCPESITEFNH